MEPSECPPWIDPGNAFRIVVKCEKFKANLDYGELEMDEQMHDLWVDSSSGYNLDSFLHDMASKIIWGRSQTLAVWSIDIDSDACWKIRKNEHFEKMIQSRLNAKFAKVVVEVVDKGYQQMETRGSVANSGVTSEAQAAPTFVEGLGETFSSNAQVNQDDMPAQEDMIPEDIDWDSLVILPEANQDGEANVLVDEDRVFEAFGFKEAEQAASTEARIPPITEELQHDMRDAGVSIDDIDPMEPVIDWDRDNPPMTVGTIYPCMNDFRLAVRQHAIVNEFELGTEKSDKGRFRGFCKATGCPWIIRAKK